MITGYMNKDEFGVDRHDAIVLFAGRAQVRHYLRTKVNDLSMTVEARKLLFDDLTKREAALTVEIVKAMAHLEAEDIHRLLTEYEGDAT